MKMRKNNEFTGKQIKENEFFLNSREADAKASAFSLCPTFNIERELFKEGHEWIAGIDEAGRGALAGPLAIGVVIFSKSFINSPPENDTKNIRDSKKLSHKKRENLYDYIKSKSVLAKTFFASHKIIDTINVNRATEYLINKFLEKTEFIPDVIIMDGNFSFKLKVPVISICKGDATSISIASASIMAKVKRDYIMNKLDTSFPGYDFSINKGYGTKKHIEKIIKTGHSSIHRKSYDPLRSIIEMPENLSS